MFQFLTVRVRVYVRTCAVQSDMMIGTLRMTESENASLYCAARFFFCKSIAFWKVPKLRPFLLLVTCR